MSYTHIIIGTHQLSEVDLSQTCITSRETLYFSQDGTKTFIDWLGDTPNFVSLLQGYEGPYTDDEMSQILATPEWQPKEQDEESISPSIRSIFSRLVGK